MLILVFVVQICCFIYKHDTFAEILFVSTTMESNKHSSDYKTEFDTNVYLEFYNKIFDVNNDDNGLLEFRMKPLHVFWSNFQACSPSDEFGVRCLEFGGDRALPIL